MKYEFNKQVDIEKLVIEIKASSISGVLDYIISEPNRTQIFFKQVLNQPNSSELTTIVNSHSVSFIPDVTPRQIRIKLLMLGITEQTIDDAINTLASPQKESAMITWKYSTMFQRNNPLVPLVAQLLNYNSQQLDQIWIEAGQL